MKRLFKSISMKRIAPPPPPPTSTLKKAQSNGDVYSPLNYDDAFPDDENMNELSTKMQLTVVLPGGKRRSMSVDTGMPMMDVLVRVAINNRLVPANILLHVPDPDKSGESILYKPNTAVGSLGAHTVYVVAKNHALESKRTQSKPGAQQQQQQTQPFEVTQRVQVNLPQGQLTVLRLSPHVPLYDLLTLVCRERNLDERQVALKHPRTLQDLDPARSLADYELSEVTVVTTVKGASEMMNVDEYPRQAAPSSVGQHTSASSEKDQKKKHKKSFLGFIGRKKSKDKQHPQNLSVHDNNHVEAPRRPASSAPAGGVAVLPKDAVLKVTHSGPVQNEANNKEKTVSDNGHSETPIKPVPGIANDVSFTSVAGEKVEGKVATRPAGKTHHKKRHAPAPPPPTQTQLAKVVEKMPHSRHSSDSSGYHETPSASPDNLASPYDTRLTNETSVAEVSTTQDHRKKKAPVPFMPAQPSPEQTPPDGSSDTAKHQPPKQQTEPQQVVPMRRGRKKKQAPAPPPNTKSLYISTDTPPIDVFPVSDHPLSAPPSSLGTPSPGVSSHSPTCTDSSLVSEPEGGDARGESDGGARIVTYFGSSDVTTYGSSTNNTNASANTSDNPKVSARVVSESSNRSSANEVDMHQSFQDIIAEAEQQIQLEEQHTRAPKLEVSEFVEGMHSMTSAIVRDATTSELEATKKTDDVSTPRSPPASADSKRDATSESLLLAAPPGSEQDGVRKQIVASFNQIMADENIETATPIRDDVTRPQGGTTVGKQAPMSRESRSAEGSYASRETVTVATTVRSERQAAPTEDAGGYAARRQIKKEEVHIARQQQESKPDISQTNDAGPVNARPSETRSVDGRAVDAGSVAARATDTTPVDDVLDWQYQPLPQRPKKKITVNLTDFASVKRSGLHTEPVATGDRPVFRTVLAIGNAPHVGPPLQITKPSDDRKEAPQLRIGEPSDNYQVAPPLRFGEPSKDRKVALPMRFGEPSDDRKVAPPLRFGEQPDNYQVAPPLRFGEPSDKKETGKRQFNDRDTGNHPTRFELTPAAPTHSGGATAAATFSVTGAAQNFSEASVSVTSRRAPAVQTRCHSTAEVMSARPYTASEPVSATSRPKVHIPPAKHAEYKPPWMTARQSDAAPRKTVTSLKIGGDAAVAPPGDDLERQFAALQSQASAWQQQILANQQLLQHNAAIPEERLLVLSELQRQMLNQQLIQQQQPPHTQQGGATTAPPVPVDFSVRVAAPTTTNRFAKSAYSPKPYSAPPPAPPPDMRRSLSSPGYFPISKESLRAALKPVSERKVRESDPRFGPKMAPREELMIAIRNTGGSTGLKKGEDRAHLPPPEKTPHESLLQSIIEAGGTPTPATRQKDSNSTLSATVVNANAPGYNAVANGDAGVGFMLANGSVAGSSNIDKPLDGGGNFTVVVNGKTPHVANDRSLPRERSEVASNSWKEEQVPAVPKSPKDDVIKAITSSGGIAGLRQVSPSKSFHREPSSVIFRSSSETF
ncbi:PREDICTED: uncharacterized protein LOC106810371 isoform X2 [Priapulus caudatus]|uniref:Uncharacterized protein LOC106810371 isoform X2 n=1 Tax=Priapulus caudatus TaxID=37621 RepID=A0ABM1EAG6_PRICU|nr:PREDICTED: uncharacterized protein LOC106810371 isoform X2 [Priapulus caudatus]